MDHLVIIGNGISGVTAARTVRKTSKMKITIISGETDHFFSRTALMYIYMGHMKYEHTKPYEDWFWEKNGINLIKGWVEKIDTDNKYVEMKDGRIINWSKLLLATGSQPNKFGWPGQDLPGVQGFYSLQDLELMEQNTAGIDHAIIVGGGLIGIEVAEMLHSRNIPVTFLVRENNFWDIILPEEEAKMINREIVEHGIDLRLATELKEILPDKNGRVRAVVTDKDEEISCGFVALTVGVHPNISLVKNSKIETGRGVLVNDFLETSVPDVYAAGDCAEIIVPGEARNRIEQLWYTGRMQGESVGKTIAGKRTKYERGIWFNSAKFLDLEYQTYGFVSNIPLESENSFYWEHENGKHALRIVYKKENRAVTGINVFGIRMRHKVCENWIRERRPLEYVLTHLRDANFDPEFFKRHEQAVIDHYNKKNPQNKLQLRRRRLPAGLFSE